MSCLTNLLEVIYPDTAETPEDIFASAPGLIFTDDIVNLHGTPDALIVYKSVRFGNIKLRTADPSIERERVLFSHFLWNAGLKIADLISTDPGWSVAGETVIELGAGVGLAGIVATLAGAQHIILTDYPAQIVLDNLKANVKRNLSPALRERCNVIGHEWGLLEPFAEQRHSCTRVIAADCFWMPHEHANLVSSILHFLSASSSARVFVVAGFHTGRLKLAAFFDEAQARGLAVEEIFEEDAYGQRRSWDRERDGGIEDHTERKKWLVLAKLLRRKLDDERLSGPVNGSETYI